MIKAILLLLTLAPLGYAGTTSITRQAGNLVIDYKAVASLSPQTSDVHKYTVSASRTMIFKKVYASSSGLIKATVSVDLGSGLIVVFTAFNSAANPNIEITMPPDILRITTGLTVTVTITGVDVQAMDVYSTIVGEEI